MQVITLHIFCIKSHINNIFKFRQKYASKVVLWSHEKALGLNKFGVKFFDSQANPKQYMKVERDAGPDLICVNTSAWPETETGPEHNML